MSALCVRAALHDCACHLVVRPRVPLAQPTSANPWPPLCMLLRRNSGYVRTSPSEQAPALLVEPLPAMLGPCPEGATQASPGQRPGSRARYRQALKGRHNRQPPRSGIFVAWHRTERFVEVERGTVRNDSLRLNAAPYEKLRLAAANFAPGSCNCLRRCLVPAPKGLPKPAQGNALGHVCVSAKP